MLSKARMIVAAGSLMMATPVLAGPDHDHADCPENCAMACCVDLEALTGFQFQAPDLFIGDDAPSLDLAHFVKGDSVDGFEDGTVYVVEFWATWCGPCIAAFPHISELQKHYGDKVQVIGVNIWDRQQDRSTGEFTESQQDWISRIDEFVEGQGDKMNYSVALQQGTSMQENWMKAGGRNGIPSAFIVDQKGKIAWVGHPMSIDETLEAAVKGEIDYEAAIQEAKNEQLVSAAYRAGMTKMNSEEKAEAEDGYTIMRALVMQHGKDNAGMLNQVAWPVLDPNSPVTHRDYEFALELGKRAAELTKFEDPMILDTYAYALFKTGNIKEAAKQQRKALQLVKNSEEWSRYTEEFEARLEEIEAAG